MTTTKTQGWQKHSWEWAKARESFGLQEVKTEHFPFCEMLSATYQGKYPFFTFDRCGYIGLSGIP